MPDMHVICAVHAKNIPSERHPAYVLYHDNAGVIPICKAVLDNWLDSADDDPFMEPKGIKFLKYEVTQDGNRIREFQTG